MSDLGESLEPWAVGSLGSAGSSGPEAPVVSDGLMSVLEERVAALVAQHREAGQQVESLRSELEVRDARLAELAKQVSSDEQLRGELRERLARVIERVRELERAESGDAVK